MRDYIQLHLVILAWGFTAILGKLIELPAVDLVIWRTALAALGFGAFALILRQKLRLPGLTAARILLLGFLLGFHWLLFFGSARLATASVSLAALPTVMLFCTLIEPWVDGSRKWRPLELVMGTVMVGAVWLIYQVELRYWLGFTVALGAAFLAALVAVFSKQMVGRHHYTVLGFYQMLGACAAALVGWPFFATASTPLFPASATDALWLLVLALLCTVAAYAGYMDVLRRMSVFTVNVVYNLEPIYGIILAALIFGSQEHMSPGFYVGAAIIAGSVLFLPWLKRYIEPPIS